MAVFSRHLFAYPTTSQKPKTIAKVTFNFMIKHEFLPTTIISDKGPHFLSQVIEQAADIPGITLEHATTKHTQTFGMLEGTHAPLKKTLKIETGEQRSMWHK